MSFIISWEDTISPDLEVEITEKDHNIKVYSAALEKIIQKENPTLDDIRAALIPTKNGKILKVKVGNEWKELKGFDRNKTSFAKRSWAKMDKQLQRLEAAYDKKDKNQKKYQKDLENTVEMFREISNDSKNHPKSMFNDPVVYQRIYSDRYRSVADIVQALFVVEK